MRGIEIDADIVLKATNVDGVYDCDPKKNPDAIKFSTLSYDDVISRQLAVMDLTAFCLARDHSMPIRVFNMASPGIMAQIMIGTDEGTLIGSGETTND